MLTPSGYLPIQQLSTRCSAEWIQCAQSGLAQHKLKPKHKADVRTKRVNDAKNCRSTQGHSCSYSKLSAGNCRIQLDCLSKFLDDFQNLAMFSHIHFWANAAENSGTYQTVTININWRGKIIAIHIDLKMAEKKASCSLLLCQLSVCYCRATQGHQVPWQATQVETYLQFYFQQLLLFYLPDTYTHDLTSGIFVTFKINPSFKVDPISLPKSFVRKKNLKPEHLQRF